MLQLDAGNLKAIFRGARAALKLGEWSVCRQLVQQGLAREADAQELLQIQQVRRIGVLDHVCLIGGRFSRLQEAVAPGGCQVPFSKWSHETGETIALCGWQQEASCKLLLTAILAAFNQPLQNLLLCPAASPVFCP